MQNSWRKSYSLREKAKLKDLDVDGGCRKKVLRFLKAMTNTDYALKGICSYDWKNLLFHLDDKKEKLTWKSEEDFVEKVFYSIRLMAYFVENKDLPLYFQPKKPKINLFCDMDDKTRNRIRSRLMSLYTNEKKFSKKINSTNEEKKTASTTSQPDVTTTQEMDDEPVDVITQETSGSVQSNTVEPHNGGDDDENDDKNYSVDESDGDDSDSEKSSDNYDYEIDDYYTGYEPTGYSDSDNSDFF